MNASLWQVFSNGLINENPTLRLVIGMCAPLAVTTSVANGFWMGMAVIFVLTASNVLVSLLRKIIPREIRIPVYVVVIATFTTVADLSLQALQPDVHAKLGVFVPLIVVNCIILARAEAFASKNTVLYSAADGVGMGLGFTMALLLLATLREVLGNGTFWGMRVMPINFEPSVVMVLPPGAFVTLGYLLGALNLLTRRSDPNKEVGQ